MSKMKEFVNYLREKYEKSDLSSIRELGRKSGVSFSYITKLMNDKKENPPSPEILEKLSNHLPCTYIDLMIKAGYIEEIEDDHLVKELQKDNYETGNPDIRAIARAGNKMTPKQAAELKNLAERLFPDAFDKTDN